MRRSRVVTSWINTLLLTVAVSFGVVSLSHHLSPAVSASTATHAAATHTSATSASAVTTGALSSTPPVTVTYRGDDGSFSRGDR